MASTLGVLDVLSRLREESDRASTALSAQEAANRSLLQKCIEAETESSRTDAVKQELQHQKTQLDEGRRIAETTRQEAESRLRRLQKQQARREHGAQRMRQATIAAGESSLQSSKKFRENVAESVRLIVELRARLQNKRRELESVRQEKDELDEEISSKTATRDKVKAELASQMGALAMACSKVDDVDHENEEMLARAKRVEEEIDETTQAQEEMQEMAMGLQRKNAILRNELRHLKREVEDKSGQTRRISPYPRNEDRHNHNNRNNTKDALNGGNGGGRSGDGVGGYYYHRAAPHQARGHVRPLQLDGSSTYQQQRSRNTTSNYRINNTTGNNVKPPFATAASIMGMPELRLSRAANQIMLVHRASSNRRYSDGRGRDGRSTSAAISVDADDYDAFGYQA